MALGARCRRTFSEYCVWWFVFVGLLFHSSWSRCCRRWLIVRTVPRGVLGACASAVAIVLYMFNPKKCARLREDMVSSKRVPFMSSRTAPLPAQNSVRGDGGERKALRRFLRGPPSAPATLVKSKWRDP